MRKVLLVDDNEVERQGIRFFLEKQNDRLTIQECSDGFEALTLVKKEQFNLLITDIKMPMMDGIELSKAVRKFDQEIRIVVISGYEEFEYARKLLQVGVTNYILKPVDGQELLATIKPLLGERELPNELPNLAEGVIKIFNEEYSEDLRLDQIAELLFVSPSYLSSVFKKQTGKSFVTYLTEIRMKRAEELLLETNMKVSSVAKRVGIPNVSYFNRIFKKLKGQTPVEFRESKKG